MTMFYDEKLLPLIKSTKKQALVRLAKNLLFFWLTPCVSGSPLCLSPGLCWLRCAPPCRLQDSRADAAAFGSLTRRITFTSRVLDSHEPRKSVIYVKKQQMCFFHKYMKFMKNSNISMENTYCSICVLQNFLI